MRAGRHLLPVLAAVLLTSCVNLDPGQAAPTCDPGGRDTLVLMAQSVPTAAHVPCIDTLPSGWFVNEVDIKSNGSRLRLGSDTTAQGFFLEVGFAAECDTHGAVEVPSDEEGARRFETVSAIDEGYVGTRSYLVEGGCVTYRFDVRGDGWSGVVNDSATAFSLLPRSALVEYVRERSGGRVNGL